MYFLITFLTLVSITFSQSANVYVFDNHVDVESNNGIIQGVQMTLMHESDFTIELTEDVFVGDYQTDNNSTVLLLVSNEDLEGEIFTYFGEMMIAESILVMSYNDEVIEVESNIVYFSDCDLNFDQSVNVVDVVLMVNTIFEESDLGNDVNQDGEINVVDVILMINLIFYDSFLDDESDDGGGSSDEDYALTGSWQLHYAAFYEGENCENFEGEFFGPIFEFNGIDFEVCTDANDTYGEECSHNDEFYLTQEDCEAAGYQWESWECWSCFEQHDNEYEVIEISMTLNEDGSFFKFENDFEQGSQSSYSDHDCDGDFDSCYSWSEDGIEKEFGSGDFMFIEVDIDENSNEISSSTLILNTFAEFEIKNGLNIDCNGCEVQGGCSDPIFNNEADCTVNGTYIPGDCCCMYLDQFSCEALYGVWTPAVAGSCSDGVSGDQPTCEDMGYIWFAEVPATCDYYLTPTNESYCLEFGGLWTSETWEWNTWTSGVEPNCNETYFNNCIELNNYIYHEQDIDTLIVEELSEDILRLKEIVIDDWTDIEGNYYYETYCQYWEYLRTESLSIGGCMDDSFINYNPYATYDDGTCNNDECDNYYQRDSKNKKSNSRFRLD